MVCPCLRVSQEDIEQAIENGASNFKDVKKKTKIVTKCGKCKNRAKCLVREIFAKQEMIEEAQEGVCLGCQGDFFEPLECGEEGTKKEKPCKKKKECKNEKSCIGKKEKKKEQLFEFAFPEPNETGYDYRDAVHPTEELDEIMKAFDFYKPAEE